MRFPRFHYGIAIALGLSMLCMSSVPVFADGISAPTVTGSVTGANVTLSWNVPIGADSFIIRRGTDAAPANTSQGTLVATTADTATTSYTEINLADGTYYYSVFAVGFTTSAPGSAGPFTIAVPRGSKRKARLARQQLLLNPTWSDTQPPSLSDVGIFQSTRTVAPKPAAPPAPVVKAPVTPRRVRSKVRLHAKPFMSVRPAATRPKHE